MSRLTAPEERAIKRLGHHGCAIVGDIEGPLTGESEILSATWMSVRKRIDEARVHSARERGAISLWTGGKRFYERLEAAVTERLGALGLVGRGRWVRMGRDEVAEEILRAGKRVGVRVLLPDEVQQEIDEEMHRDLTRGFY